MELDYLNIFRQLNRKGVDYILVGGLAVNFHGVPRMTYDLDLAILLNPDNLLAFINQLTDWGYRPKAPVDPMNLLDDKKRDEWIKEKNLKAFNFYHDNSPVGEIDLVLEFPFSYNELKSRMVVFKVQDVEIPTVSIPDLIKIKLHSGRKQDLSDIESLTAILER
jgi:predicted nucleotidyltransferase